MEQHIQKLTLGHGIIHLVPSSLKGVLQVKMPTLESQRWNTRATTEEGIKKLWAHVQHGDNVCWLSIEHAVTIGVHGRAQLDKGWTGEWNEPITWSETGQSDSVLLINGAHRMGLLTQYVVREGLMELQSLVRAKEQDKTKIKRVQAEVVGKCRWVATLIDLGMLFVYSQVGWNLLIWLF